MWLLLHKDPAGYGLTARTALDEMKNPYLVGKWRLRSRLPGSFESPPRRISEFFQEGHVCFMLYRDQSSQRTYEAASDAETFAVAQQ